MGLTNENVGPKILAKIKIYVLTRAELLFTLCYEIPCNYSLTPVLLLFIYIYFWPFTDGDIEAVAEAFDDQTSEDLVSMMSIPKVKDCINQNRSTFYSLLSSHGDKTNLIKFANIMNDHDR